MNTLNTLNTCTEKLNPTQGWLAFVDSAEARGDVFSLHLAVQELHRRAAEGNVFVQTAVRYAETAQKRVNG